MNTGIATLKGGFNNMLSKETFKVTGYIWLTNKFMPYSGAILGLGD
jgi:hypothetical protein